MRKEEVVPGMRVRRTSSGYNGMALDDEDTVIAFIEGTGMGNGVHLEKFGKGHDYSSLTPVEIVPGNSSNYAIF